MYSNSINLATALPKTIISSRWSPPPPPPIGADVYEVFDIIWHL